MIQDAVFQTYIELAGKACDAGQLALGERMLEAALEETKRLDHSPFEDAITTLAYVHYQRGKFRKAELVLQSGLKMYEKVLGVNNMHVAALMLNLAELYLSIKKDSSARVMYERYIKVIECLHGYDHTLLERPLTQLAYINTRRGRFETAQLFYMRAVKIRNLTHNRGSESSLESKA
jgi:tetratricopeptide (TPR) repeat protein